MLRILLTPFSWLVGLTLVLRHALYDGGLLKSTRPTVPTIAIGNLALGGTGKTPMLELVLRTLADQSPLATLSRGYGRSGSDIHEVQAEDTAERSGDEPLQVKRKFPDVRVFVGADRVKAIEQIQKHVTEVQAVVLDDALQHRRLDASLNILLTTWQQPWSFDALLPAGRLRDLPSRAKAAQVVVVTKCPALPSAAEQERWRRELGLGVGQELFFSGIEYLPLRYLGRPSSPPKPWRRRDGATVQDRGGDQGGVLLITGIADPAPLLAHVQSLFASVEHAAFPDHHRFTDSDLQGLAARCAKFAPGPKMLLTTEKDATRLLPLLPGSALEDFPLAVIAMQAVILNEPERFAALIRDHVATHPAHR